MASRPHHAARWPLWPGVLLPRHLCPGASPLDDCGVGAPAARGRSPQGRIPGLLAHELRNPLAPIRTGLELIRLSGDTPQSVERVRSMMERQVNQMVRLIDDLLDVSRITSGKIVLQRAPTPLAELVQSADRRAARRHRRRADRAHGRLAAEPHPSWMSIRPASCRSSRTSSTTRRSSRRGGKDSSVGRRFVPRRVTGRAGGRSPCPTPASASRERCSPRVFELFTQGESPTRTLA